MSESQTLDDTAKLSSSTEKTITDLTQKVASLEHDKTVLEIEVAHIKKSFHESKGALDILQQQKTALGQACALANAAASELQIQKAALGQKIPQFLKSLLWAHASNSQRRIGKSPDLVIQRIDRDNAIAERDRAIAERDRAIAELDAIYSSTTWRALQPLHAGMNLLPPRAQRLGRSVLRLGWQMITPWRIPQRLRHRRQHAELLPSPNSYFAWAAAYDTLTDADRTAIKAHIASFRSLPLISVVMPAYNTPEHWLRSAIKSIQNQLYSNWELCIADDASPSANVMKVIKEFSSDKRIKFVRREINGNISAATNSALALATGEFIALMDHDDELAERALYEVVALLNDHPDTDMIYSDQDIIDGNGNRCAAYFKPDWDPDLFLGQNLFSHLGVYRRDLVSKVGGLREGFEGSQDYDLALRVSRLTEARQIRHIPAILYHWRHDPGTAPSFSASSMEKCGVAARRTIDQHLKELGVKADLTPLPNHVDWTMVRFRVPEPTPLVSIIVLTRDRADLLSRCAHGLLYGTEYSQFELIIVDNGTHDEDARLLLEALETDSRVRVLKMPGPFNYSALNNRAVREAQGEIIVLLNNDIEVIDADWLSEMVSHAVRPEVGAVGAKLLFPDGRVQHGGIAVGAGGIAAYYHYLSKHDDFGNGGQLALLRSVSAVTAACLAMRRELFEEVGGLDEINLKIAFNDVDLCLRLRERGYRVVWTPRAQLYHAESSSRGSDQEASRINRFGAEIDYMKRKWGTSLNDPYYNPNFSRSNAQYELACPPLIRKSWYRYLNTPSIADG